MSVKKIIQMMSLNLGIALANIVIFSEGLLGFGFVGKTPIVTALSAMVLFLDLSIFGYGNYSILKEKKQIQLFSEEQLENPKDYEVALEDISTKVFDNHKKMAMEQIQRIRQKNETLDCILQQHFTVGELSYTKFQSTIQGTNKIFFDNLKRMINRMNIFDEQEYIRLYKKEVNTLTSETNALKREIFEEHITAVKNIVVDNENILFKLDNLLLEISKLDESSKESIEELPAIVEMNELISQTKYYKAAQQA